uniref:RRM domain-containing protein n=1 Tax=Peromyscus maniculatus bairdii TaxID=230844 RepID=A0A8C8UJ93_PERMB
MEMQAAKRANIRLPPKVNRILYIRNLPYKITVEEMYDIFGKYGSICQIRVGNTPETGGRADAVYEDIFDAKNACDHLSRFNVCNRYLVVYYNANQAFFTLKTSMQGPQSPFSSKLKLNAVNSRLSPRMTCLKLF